MKVYFNLEVFFFDDRDGQHDMLEVIWLTHSCEMSCTPQIGMSVIIGKNEDDNSEHDIESVSWRESDDSLHITVQNYETQIGEHEDDSEWEYFDGLIKSFIENDGWEVWKDMSRTRRTNCRWKETNE